MTRKEEIRKEAEMYLPDLYAYGSYQTGLYVREAFKEGAEWADAHQPQVAYLEHEIERLKSKLQAANDLNTLLTAELEKAKSPWISVEDRLPEDDLIFELVAVKLKDYPGWYRGYYCGTWHYIDECCDKIRAFDVTHWMPIPLLPTK